MTALADKPGRGRKAIFKTEKTDHVKLVNKIVDDSPSNLYKTLSEIETQLG